MLTFKQRLFVDQYKACRNGAEAARQAGYAPASAGRSAYRLLQDDEIKAAIDQFEADEAKKAAESSVIPPKREYLKRTFKMVDEVKQEPNKIKLWELGGKAAGYLKDNEHDPQVININLAKNMIVAVKDDAKLDSLRSLLSE